MHTNRKFNTHIFCNLVLEKVNSGELDAKEIFFSDEAWFYLHGQVCSQNYRYYID